MVKWLEKITLHFIQALSQGWSGTFIRREFLFEAVRFFEAGGGAVIEFVLLLLSFLSRKK